MLTQKSDGSKIVPKIVGKRFIVQKKIGAGSFGSIYEGRDVNNGEQVAIKFENMNSKYPQLINESRLYRLLHNKCGLFFSFLLMFFGKQI